MIPAQLTKELSVYFNPELDPQFKDLNIATAMKKVITSQVLLNINLSIINELKSSADEIQVQINDTTTFQSNYFTDEALTEFFQLHIEEIRFIVADYIKNAGYNVRLSNIDKGILAIYF